VPRDQGQDQSSTVDVWSELNSQWSSFHAILYEVSRATVAHEKYILNINYLQIIHTLHPKFETEQDT